MKVVPIATSSPCRVDTVVGVDRSRTFSLSNVILHAWGGGASASVLGQRAAGTSLGAPHGVHALQQCTAPGMPAPRLLPPISRCALT